MPLFEHETHTRSVAKAVNWRLTGSLDTLIISYIVTGNFVIAGSIAVTELLTKIALFYFHEQACHRIGVGKLRRIPLRANPARP